jgi:Arc/MetJ-type ribon-helix-helix transcriptional regulator
LFRRNLPLHLSDVIVRLIPAPSLEEATSGCYHSGQRTRRMSATIYERRCNMVLRINPEIESKIFTFLEDGRYADANDVIARALDLLSKQDDLEQLRAEIMIGVDEYNLGEVIEENDEFWDNLDREIHERVTRSAS